MFSQKNMLGLLLGGVGVVALVAAGSRPAVPAQGQGRTPAAKLTPWAAMDIANQEVHGKPLSANFENDEGKWIYDVFIVKGGALNVVEVDANTRKAGKPEVSSPDEEAKELVADLNKALGKPAPKATGKGEKGEKD